MINGLNLHEIIFKNSTTKKIIDSPNLCVSAGVSTLICLLYAVFLAC